MPFHSNPNSRTQRARWLENFYPKLSEATRKAQAEGFGKQMAHPPLAIYFPDNQLKTREEIQRELIERLTGGGGGGGGDIIPPGGGGDSSTDSGEGSTSITPSTTTTGGGDTTGSAGSGTGVSTVSDYNTSDPASTTGGGDTASISGGVSTEDDGPTTSPSTTGGGGTSFSGVNSGYTTGFSGTIQSMSGDPPPSGPAPTSGSGTSGTGYEIGCDTCFMEPTPTETRKCGVALETTDINGDPISVPWVWSDCFLRENLFHTYSEDGFGGCIQVTACPLISVDPVSGLASSLCKCALVYGCGTAVIDGGTDTNCSNPGPPGTSCSVKIGCCYNVTGGPDCYYLVAETVMKGFGNADPCVGCA